jgi:Ca-activated chloride channel homolog
MTDGPSEPTLDSLLNELAVPAGLLPRLREIAALSDVELDVRLRDIDVPGGLVERLQWLVADEALDAELRRVSIPVSVLPRTHIIPHVRRRSRLRQWALAASLMVLIGAGLTALLGSIVSALRPVPLPPLAMVVIDQGPLDLVALAEPAVAILPDPGDGLARLDAGGLSDETMRLLTTFERSPLGPAGQLAADIRQVWNPWDNWLLMRWGALGYAPAASAALPELTALTAPVAQGMEAPLVRGYDREFLYSRGIQPPILTAFDPAALGLDVPLANRTDSVDRVRRLAAAGRLPSPDQVRVEDFITAVQPHGGASAEPGTVAIRTAGGPSVFNRSEAGLLQIRVQSGLHRQRSLPATHLVLAIDTSASMIWDGALDSVRSAVAEILQHLGPHDRLSVILFAGDVVEVVREVGRSDQADLDQLAAVLEHASLGGGANLGAALQQAISLALESETAANLPRRLVLMTASRPLLGRAEADGVRKMFAEAAKGDFGLEVCELGPEEVPAEVWLELAGSVPCTVRRPQGADRLRWALVEVLTGDSSLAATEVKLHVDFNPRAVAAYRLIGHDSTGFGGLLPAALETDLHVGETASALFEVWLYPNEEDDVATVRVQWSDPAEGKSRRAGPQRVSRLQFATALEGSALALQASAIAAEAAEVLKQSFNFELISPDRYRYEPKPSGLEHVLAEARHAAAGLEKQAPFRRFVELLEALSRLGSVRSAVSARSGTRGIIEDQWREYGLK